MVRVLATLLRPDRGQARVAGHDVVTQAAQVRMHIGLTGQYAALDESLTGRANLVMIGRLGRLPTRAAKARAAELLGQFDLTDAADRGVKTYSGGMRRRLDLAASLVTRPQILFLDEPTTGLDLPSRMVTWDAVRGLAADGTTVLLTTQHLDEADNLAGPDRRDRPRAGDRRRDAGPAQGQGWGREGQADRRRPVQSRDRSEHPRQARDRRAKTRSSLTRARGARDRGGAQDARDRAQSG